MIEKKKVRVAIAGFGYAGYYRYNALKKIKDIDIVCISDEKIENLVKKKNISKKILLIHDFKKIFSFEFDAIFICLPNYYAEQAQKLAIKKNLHFFCEKPPARSLKNFNKIIQQIKNKKLKVQYGFNHRYHNSILYVKKIIDQKKFGKIINIKGVYGKPKISNFENDWRSNRKISGGGILIDQGIHLLDLLIYFCGDCLDLKSYKSNKYWNLNVEDNAYILLKFKNNIFGFAHSSATKWLNEFKIEIMLENGQINLKGLVTGTRSYGNERIEIFDKTNNRNNLKKVYKKDVSWDLETKQFIRAVIKNIRVKNGNISDAKKIMRIVDKVYNMKDAVS